MIVCLLLDDDINRKQVKYVFDTICMIYKGSFDYYLANSKEEVGKCDILLYYGKEPQELNTANIQMVNKQTDEKRYSLIKWTVEDERLNAIFNRDIPILSGSIADNKSQGAIILKDKVKNNPLITRNNGSIIINFDIIWNIFYHITCYPENFHNSSDKKHYLSFSRRKGRDKSIIETPVVNYYIEILVYCIYLLTGTRILPHKFENALFMVNLSHDLDAIEKTIINRFKRTGLLTYKALNNISHLRFKTSFKQMRQIPRLVFWPENYWQVERVRKAENRYTMNSSFYVYLPPVKRKKNLFEKIIDPEYDAKKLNQIIPGLQKMGFEIGLHPGSKLFEDIEELSLHKKALEEITGTQVSGLRVHWLNFSIKKSWKAFHEAGFKYDSTLGFNDQPGFRAGICTPFYPYDHIKEEAIPILEIPLTIMDQTLFDYLEYSEAEAYHKAVEILSEVKKFNGAVSILWHQRTFSRDYKWGDVYERILEWIYNEKGRGCTAGEIIEQY